MAVTIIKRPHEYVPAHNEIEFSASSTQTAQPNFKFYVLITVESTGDTFEERIDPDPTTGYCYFNLRGIAEKHLTNHYYPYNTFNWHRVTNGIDRFTVNIGEEYGATGALATYAGTNVFIFAWNASLKRSERATLIRGDYDNSGAALPALRWLNNLDANTTIKTTQDLVFYFLQTDFPIYDITFNTYKNNTLYNSWRLINLITPITNTEDVYVCVNVGPAAMNAMYTANPASVTVPTFSPLFIGDEDFYTVTFSRDNRTLITDPGDAPVTHTIYLNDCAPRFDKVSLFYLNRFGAFDCVNLYGNHQKSLISAKTYYESKPAKFESSTTNSTQTVDSLASNPLSLSKKTLSSSFDVKQNYKTSGLNSNQVEILEDLFTSPSCFVCLEFGSYVRYSQDDLQYRFINEKLKTLEVNLTASTERRQFE